MRKLVLKIGRVQTLVLGWVVHQDESLRRTGILDPAFIGEADGFEIRSGTRPQLDSNILYVRGMDVEKDNMVFFYGYATEDAAINAVRKIKTIVKKVNEEETRFDSASSPIEFELVC